jgi:hypothetical protein
MLNNIIRLLKELLEMFLFLFLLMTIPLWFLPYALVIKHREKKCESEAQKCVVA